MALTRPYPIDKAWPNAIDLRKQLSGIIPREGIFPDPTTLIDVAYANGTWNVGARPFVAAFKRGGAPYTQAYGTGLGTNDASGTAWTVAAAPGSGTRVDRLWIRWVDPTQGESLTTPGGETVARAVPIFGVTAGTPAAQPWPSGVQKIAEVSVPAGAASIAGATITQVYDFAHVIGGVAVFRNQTEQDAYAAVDGTPGYRLDLDRAVERRDGAWIAERIHNQYSSVISGLVNNSLVAAGTVTLDTDADDTTDPTFGTIISGGVRLPRGIYIVSAGFSLGAAATGRCLATIYLDGAEQNTARRSIFAGEDIVATTDVVLITAATGDVTFRVLKNTAASPSNVNGRIKITKIG